MSFGLFVLLYFVLIVGMIAFDKMYTKIKGHDLYGNWAIVLGMSLMGFSATLVVYIVYKIWFFIWGFII